MLESHQQVWLLCREYQHSQVSQQFCFLRSNQPRHLQGEVIQWELLVLSRCICHLTWRVWTRQTRLWGDGESVSASRGPECEVKLTSWHCGCVWCAVVCNFVLTPVCFLLCAVCYNTDIYFNGDLQMKMSYQLNWVLLWWSHVVSGQTIVLCLDIQNIWPDLVHPDFL